MGDEYYKVVRLKTGEIILCMMNPDVRSIASVSHLTLVEPVQIMQIKETSRNNEVVGESFVMRPWIGLSDSDEFVIGTDIVLTVGDMKLDVRKQYKQYTTHTIKVKQAQREQEEKDIAIEQLLRDVTPGEVRIIDEESSYYGDYDPYEED